MAVIIVKYRFYNVSHYCGVRRSAKYPCRYGHVSLDICILLFWFVFADEINNTRFSVEQDKTDTKCLASCQLGRILGELRSCPHLSGYFLIRNFFFSVQKFSPPHVSRFKWICPSTCIQTQYLLLLLSPEHAPPACELASREAIAFRLVAMLNIYALKTGFEFETHLS